MLERVSLTVGGSRGDGRGLAWTKIFDPNPASIARPLDLPVNPTIKAGVLARFCNGNGTSGSGRTLKLLTLDTPYAVANFSDIDAPVILHPELRTVRQRHTLP